MKLSRDWGRLGMSFSEWKTIKLCEVANVLSGYAFKSKEFCENGVPVIKIKNIVSPHVSLDDVQYISKELANEKSRYKLKYNDILISLTGSKVNQFASAVGKVGRVKEYKPMMLNQRVGKIEIIDENKYNQDLLYYLISTDETHYKLASIAGGAANQANISPAIIENLLLPCPPIEEQKAIAETLSCLDDKIELNNHINKNLEEMAQVIFKRWFVDFEFPNESGQPYKSNGGKMVDSELGIIPKGWRAVELGNVTTNKRAKTKSNDFRVLSAVNTGNLVLSEEYFTKQVFSKDLSKYIIVKKREFAYNPARVNIGSIGMNEYDFSGCVSPVYVVFKAEEDYQWFFKLFIKTDSFKREVIKRASGSVRQTMKYSDFTLIKTVYPPKDVIEKFNQIFESCYHTYKELTKETEILSKIRNELLPKLMSGEIRVPIEVVV